MLEFLLANASMGTLVHACAYLTYILINQILEAVKNSYSLALVSRFDLFLFFYLFICYLFGRYTSKMLLAAIDEQCKGTYDFLYLPIDFKVSISG